MTSSWSRHTSSTSHVAPPTSPAPARYGPKLATSDAPMYPPLLPLPDSRRLPSPRALPRLRISLTPPRRTCPLSAHIRPIRSDLPLRPPAAPTSLVRSEPAQPTSQLSNRVSPCLPCMTCLALPSSARLDAPCSGPCSSTRPDQPSPERLLRPRHEFKPSLFDYPVPGRASAHARVRSPAATSRLVVPCLA